MKFQCNPDLERWEESGRYFLCAFELFLGGVSSQEGEGEELDRVMEQFEIIKDEPDFSIVSEDEHLFILMSQSPMSLIRDLVKEAGELTALGLLGIVAECFGQVIPHLILSSFQYRLRDIATGHEQGLCVAKREVISLYITKVLLLTIKDYWDALSALNGNFEEKEFWDEQSIVYPDLDDQLRAAYVAGQFFASALLRVYLDEYLFSQG